METHLIRYASEDLNPLLVRLALPSVVSPQDSPCIASYGNNNRLIGMMLLDYFGCIAMVETRNVNDLARLGNVQLTDSLDQVFPELRVLGNSSQ